MGNRTTIEQVAQLAGVSRGTVDRVLNNRPHVRPDARERVLAAIAESGYLSPREAHQKQVGAALQPFHLGVLLPNEWNTQFREDVLRGIEWAKTELEPDIAKITVVSCKTDLPEEAMEHLEELVRQGVQGIAVCAQHAPSIARYIDQLAERKIPCVTFNSDLPESRRLCFVGEDIRKAGRVAGELMAKCVRAPERILATVGNLNFDGHLQRLRGFQERLTELGYPAELIVTEETFNDYETTVTVVERAIRDYPDLGGIYMANLSITGCAEAVRASGRKDRIHIICHDINDSVRRLLEEGMVDFTIPQDIVRQGYTPLRLLAAYLRTGRKPDTTQSSGGIQVLCAENARQGSVSDREGVVHAPVPDGI